MRRLILAAVAVEAALALTACGAHSSRDTQGATRPSSRAASAGRHTPTFVYPLTGLPAPNRGAIRRPALSVKIDNIEAAMPQAGLNQADIVTEALVEGGLTRLFATFQSHQANLVGPIRSARPVDADLLRELHGGIFAYSGADPREIAPAVQHSDAVLISNDDRPQWFSRATNRTAPDNVMSSTQRLYQAGFSLKHHIAAPPQLFTYSSTPGAHARGVQHMSLTYPAASATWTYNGRVYDRSQNGASDRLADGQVVSAQNVVVLSTKYYLTSIIDDAGNADPYDLVTGRGRCWVLRDGKLTIGHWTRSSYKVKVKLIGRKGRQIPLHTGRTWIELLPPTSVPHFSR